MAAERVFSTTELFENIFYFADNRTLLLSQCVSKTFQLNIKGSNKLQRKLFFVLEPARPQWTYDDIEVNPLIATKRPLHHSIQTSELCRVQVDFTNTFLDLPNHGNEAYTVRTRHGLWQLMFLLNSNISIPVDMAFSTKARLEPASLTSACESATVLHSRHDKLRGLLCTPEFTRRSRQAGAIYSLAASHRARLAEKMAVETEKEFGTKVNALARRVSPGDPEGRDTFVRCAQQLRTKVAGEMGGESKGARTSSAQGSS